MPGWGRCGDHGRGVEGVLQEASERASVTGGGEGGERGQSCLVWVEGDKRKDGGQQAASSSSHFYRPRVELPTGGVSRNASPPAPRLWLHARPAPPPGRTCGAAGGTGLGLDQLSLSTKIASCPLPSGRPPTLPPTRPDLGKEDLPSGGLDDPQGPDHRASHVREWRIMFLPLSDLADGSAGKSR